MRNMRIFMMSKDQELMFFLGKLECYIEQASYLAQGYNDEPISELMIDIEEFFHRGINKLFTGNSDNVVNGMKNWRYHNGRG
jgi:hypothetical protein